MISYYDYAKRYPHAKSDLLRIVRDTAQSGEFILKSAVERFEAELCGHTGAAHAICVSSGTFAITLALKAAGIGLGDEVITPAYSYVASASAICAAGATPVFVDVEADGYTLCPKVAATALNDKTRAVVAVHLFSGLADMSALRAVLPPRVLLLEDAATAYGAQLGGVPAGRLGDIGVYSFFPAKPLGGLGDGGAVLTDDAEFARTVRMLRNHGQDGKTRFLHHLLGYNSRMDDMNARWLSERLPQEPAESARRREVARIYDAELASLPGIGLQRRRTEQFAPHAYAVQTSARDALKAYLAQHGIQTKVHFPHPLPQQAAFAEFARTDYPVAQRLAREVLALPLSAHFTDNEARAIATRVAEFRV